MNDSVKPSPDLSDTAAASTTPHHPAGTFVERRRNKRVTVHENAPLDLTFVIDQEEIRSRVRDLSEDGLSVEYPASAPDLRGGLWLANVMLHRQAANPLQLRTLITSTCRVDQQGCRVLRLYATDQQARAGLWTAMDWLPCGQFGPTEDTNP